MPPRSRARTGRTAHHPCHDDDRLLHAYVEAKDAKIALEVVEGCHGGDREEKMPVLVQEFKLMWPIRDICKSIVRFQKEFDMAAANQQLLGSEAGDRFTNVVASMVYGVGPGAAAPPPPPLADAPPPPPLPTEPWQPVPPVAHTWESDILDLQPSIQDYIERNRGPVGTWHRLYDEEICSLSNFEPIPLDTYKPVDFEPSGTKGPDDELLPLVYRNAATIRTPPVSRGGNIWTSLPSEGTEPPLTSGDHDHLAPEGPAAEPPLTGDMGKDKGSGKGDKGKGRNFGKGENSWWPGQERG